MQMHCAIRPEIAATLRAAMLDPFSAEYSTMKCDRCAVRLCAFICERNYRMQGLHKRAANPALSHLSATLQRLLSYRSSQSLAAARGGHIRGSISLETETSTPTRPTRVRLVVIYLPRLKSSAECSGSRGTCAFIHTASRNCWQRKAEDFDRLRFWHCLRLLVHCGHQRKLHHNSGRGEIRRYASAITERSVHGE